LEKAVSRLKNITLFNLIFCIAVIIWGAFVRATGSGAGCGDHWPKCNGELIPRTQDLETIIEFTHRASSGLFLLGVFFALIYTLRNLKQFPVLKKAAYFSLVFVLIEAAIGAGLVLLEYVADDLRVARVYWVGSHLVNTLLLVACLSVNFWLVKAKSFPRKIFSGLEGKLFGFSLLLFLVVASSGAITALGDTLFPATSLIEGIKQDFSPTAHFTIKLRKYHPIIAVVTAFFMSWYGRQLIFNYRGTKLELFGKLLSLGVVMQIALGFLNMFLLAPVWLQMVHLFLANLLWIVLVIAGVERAAYISKLKAA